MKNIYKNILVLGIISLLVSPTLIFAQAPQFPITEVPQTSPLLGPTLKDTLLNIFWWVFTILTWLAGAFAVLWIIYGGIQVIWQAKIDEGKNRLIWGAVGLAIALLSWAVVKFIENVITRGTTGF